LPHGRFYLISLRNKSAKTLKLLTKLLGILKNYLQNRASK
jgi:hypothetical protein